MSNIVIGVRDGIVQYVYAKEGANVIVLDHDYAEPSHDTIALEIDNMIHRQSLLLVYESEGV